MKRRDGVRGVAVFEATKGVVVLAIGLGVISCTSTSGREFMEDLVGHTRLNPAKHLPRSIVDAVAGASDGTLVLYASAAFLYTLVRFVEAFGLWRRYRWAEWFGLSTAVIYIPFELYGVARKPGHLSTVFLIVNLAIVWILVRALQGRRPAPESVASTPS